MHELGLVVTTLPVLFLELVALVTVIRKFKSPYATVVSIAALFFVNISLYYVIIQFWITQTPTE
jgi:hypothetical protein